MVIPDYVSLALPEFYDVRYDDRRGTGGARLADLDITSYVVGPDRRVVPAIPQTLPDIPAFIRRIKSAFSPSMAEIGAYFGVSRQTVYNWMAGEGVDFRHRKPISKLQQALEAIDNASQTVREEIARSRFSDGASFMQRAARSEADPVALAEEMIRNAQAKLEERRTMPEIRSRKTHDLELPPVASWDVDE